MNRLEAVFAVAFAISALGLIASLVTLLLTQRLIGGSVNRPVTVFAVIFAISALGLVASLAILLLTDPGE